MTCHNKRVPPSDSRGSIQDKTMALMVTLQPQILMIPLTAYARGMIAGLGPVVAGASSTTCSGLIPSPLCAAVSERQRGM